MLLNVTSFLTIAIAYYYCILCLILLNSNIRYFMEENGKFTLSKTVPRSDTRIAEVTRMLSKPVYPEKHEQWQTYPILFNV